MSSLSRKQSRARRHRRQRKHLGGTPDVPRMSVCLTGRHIYVQFIDDVAGRTLASISTLEPALRDDAAAKSTLEGAATLGKLAAERAAKANISRVVFDRGGFKYHGRVKAIADAAREAGLVF